MRELMWSVWPLLAVIGACVAWARLRPARTSADDAWVWRTDLALALAVAVLYGVAAGFLMPRFDLTGGDYVEVDFAGYCRSLGALRDNSLKDWGVKHSVMTGLLLLGPTRAIGLLGALTVGALVSGGVFGLGIYLWARVAAGRVAGIWAVLFTLANQSLVWLSRSPSFYPETTAACVLGTAGVAASLRWRTPRAVLAGGCGVGLILATDVRFFNIGVWAFALLMLAVLAGPPRQLPIRALAAVAPIALSWWVVFYGHQAVMGHVPGPGAVRQAAGFLNDVQGFPRYEILPRPKGIDFVWGVDAPWAAPIAFLELLHLGASVPASAGELTSPVMAREAYLNPWLPLIGLAGAGALCMLPRRPWALLAALAPTAPFLANLYLVFHTLPHGRHYPLGMSAVPVILAVGLAAAGGERWSRAPALILGTFLAAGIFDLVPTYLAPTSPWRQPETARNRVYDSLARATGAPPVPNLVNEWPTGEDAVACVEALGPDVAAGHLWMPFSDVPVKPDPTPTKRWLFETPPEQNADETTPESAK